MTESLVNTQVGAQIRMYRKMAKISIDEMAQTIGKSRATVSKYETGAIAIDISTLFEISSVLDISASYLMDIPA
ncbi:MAG: helix-turn-helix transcriptional regulator, partial [Eubacterium sp.]